MKVKKTADVPSTEVEAKGARDVAMQILLGPADGSGEIIMRLFTLAPGGHTPLHSHPWEHLVKVEEGRGVAVDAAGETHQLEPGVSVFVPPGREHQFRNPSGEPFRFICVIPNPEWKQRT